jgi:hypothetical protein
MDIAKMTDTELKALAFDEIRKLEIAKRNIEVIERELQIRAEKGEKENGTNQE